MCASINNKKNVFLKKNSREEQGPLITKKKFLEAAKGCRLHDLKIPSPAAFNENENE